MKLSMHQASAVRFANTLGNLSAILDKAHAHAEAKKLDPALLGGLRLIADMFPLSRQVQIACDTAKGAVARLAGVEIPSTTTPSRPSRSSRRASRRRSISSARCPPRSSRAPRRAKC